MATKAGLRIKSIVGNFEKYTTKRHPNIDFIMNEDLTWHIRMRDLEGKDGELKAAEIIVKIVAPPKYPFAPPEFFFMTDTGIYKINATVCISIGTYHKG